MSRTITDKKTGRKIELINTKEYKFKTEDQRDKAKRFNWIFTYSNRGLADWVRRALSSHGYGEPKEVGNTSLKHVIFAVNKVR
jgi:hypothetical protein